MSVRILGLVVVGSSVAATAIGLALIALTSRAVIPVGHRLEEVAAYLVLQTAFTAVAAILMWRLPEHGMSWFVSGAALVSGAQFLFAGYAVHGIFGPGLPAAPIAAWLYTWTGVGLGLFVGLIVATFPDGRVREPSSRPAVALLIVAIILLVPPLALRPGPLGNMHLVDNPFGWNGQARLLELVELFGSAVAVIALLLASWRLLLRARGGTSVERQQLKWLLWSSGLLAAALAVAYPLVVGRPDPGGADQTGRYAARVALAMAMASLPVAIGLAVLRYRLYDIDLLIRRTLVYGALSLALAATYVVLIGVVQAALRPITSGSELAVAGSTLATLALAQPLRRRIQDAVDRRFSRYRYDAARTLDAFAARLRDQVDLNALEGELLEAVRATVQPTHANIWLRNAKR